MTKIDHDHDAGLRRAFADAGVPLGPHALDDAAPAPRTTPRQRRPRRNEDARLLTKRQAARVLGVDRKTTLEELIEDEHLRVVRWRGGVRIPASEVERVEREGLPERGTPPPRRPSKRAAAPNPAAAIRAIKLESL